MDGSSLGNRGRAGAGGVIRRSNGDLVLAFAVHNGHGTNTFAKGMGLLHGLQLVKNLGITNIKVEMDSMLLNILAGLNYSIYHVYRQGNYLADFLARIGAEGRSCIWNNYNDIPCLLTGLLKTDKLWLPYLRIS